MASHTARTAKPSDVVADAPNVLGEEWSSQGDLREVLEAYLFPLLTPQARVAEIGVGGGRIARKVQRRCAQLTCMDVSPKMLARAEATLRQLQQEQMQQDGEGSGAALEWVLLSPEGPAAYPERLNGVMDVVYCFDVLVHVDLHTMLQVFQGCRRLLRPGGRFFLSTANLLTPAGWRRFERQRKYTAAGFYCMWGFHAWLSWCVRTRSLESFLLPMTNITQYTTHTHACSHTQSSVPPWSTAC